MLDKKGFDLWADEYDKAVGISEEDNTYPFAGYKKILGSIYEIIMEKPKATVLDIGFGTASLTTKLYENGCIIYGQDFSSRMIELASAKMPDAHLYQGDFSQGLVEPLKQNSYDFIVATYSIHHLTDSQKIAFLKELLDHLKEGGKILIGDVAFENRDELEKCRERSGDEWDDDENYCVADELKSEFPNLRFEKVTFCSGILMIMTEDFGSHNLSTDEVTYTYKGTSVSITIREITRENIDAVLALGVNDDQRTFVSSNGDSLAQAYVYSKTAFPFAVYADSAVVGFIMMGYYEAKDYYTLWKFMIDSRYQGRGYGRKALELVIQYLKEQFDISEVYTGVVPGNIAARKLYESVGFKETGLVESGMEEMRLRLR